MRRWNLVSQTCDCNPSLGRWPPTYRSEHWRLRPSTWSSSHRETWNHCHLGDRRKRNAANRGPDEERSHRKTKGHKLKGLNQHSTLVGLVNNQPFKYLGWSTPPLRSTRFENVHLRARLESSTTPWGQTAQLVWHPVSRDTVLLVQLSIKGIRDVCQQTPEWRLQSSSSRLLLFTRPAIFFHRTSCRFCWTHHQQCDTPRVSLPTVNSTSMLRRTKSWNASTAS